MIGVRWLSSFCKNVAPTNWPISLTSILCKLMERVIKAIITGNLDRSHRVSAAHHGIIKRKSWLTNLLTIHEWALSWVDDEDKSVDLYYHDSSGALDSISYIFLLFRHQTVRLVGNALCWSKSFFVSQKLYSLKKRNLVKFYWSAHWCTTGFRVWSSAFQYVYEWFTRFPRRSMDNIRSRWLASI